MKKHKSQINCASLINPVDSFSIVSFVFLLHARIFLKCSTPRCLLVSCLRTRILLGLWSANILEGLNFNTA